MNVLHDLLSARGTLLIDGAVGTELFARGLGSGDPPEMWNVDHPDRVTAVHADYINAGSDIVLTNSFGGTGFRLKLHKLDDRCIELNRAAAQVARTAVDAHFAETGRRVLVAGSMGPTGELLEPMGSMTPETCADAFREQAIGLDEGGADVLWIETMSHLDEVAAAVEGARSVSDLPVCATLSFDTAGRTMMGVSGEAAVNRLTELGVDAIGANCGNNLADTEAALREMRAANPDVPLISKANAGMPEWHGTELHYSGEPEVMAAHAVRQREAGIQIIGACCGSSPKHLAMMRQVLDGNLPVPEVEFEVAVVRQVAKARQRTGRRSSRP
ncbi:betaine--homocysteine S-methyltransferase, partial [uncultured Ilumatobacter sp.]|uniref:betaine--homocysteine S-methyltransferase n=1 Tax=uncultured Ilumatobacter sp. TaxID=879968 RepID=UPI00374F4D0B